MKIFSKLPMILICGLIFLGPILMFLGPYLDMSWATKLGTVFLWTLYALGLVSIWIGVSQAYKVKSEYDGLFPCDIKGCKVAIGDNVKIGHSGKERYKIISMYYYDTEDEIYCELENLKNGKIRCLSTTSTKKS